jgi:peptidoglycan/LPS O-acetylase OafA/YrhL
MWFGAWSHEIRISLIFPALALLLRKFPRITLLSTIFISEICHWIISGHAATAAIDPIYTIQYLSLFSAGGFIYLRATEIRDWIKNKNYLPMLVTAVILLGLPAVHNIPMSFGAVLIVILALGSPKIERFLSGNFFVWLGKISFSLYLIHVPLILLMLHLLNGQLPLLLILPGIFLLSLTSAEVFHRVIEQPSMRAARWAGHNLVNSPFFTRQR